MLLIVPAPRSRIRWIAALVGLLLACSDTPANAQTIQSMRADQIARLRDYVLEAILPSGLVRDSLVLSPAANHFHPATPDAAGFALISLAALDHLNGLNNADTRVVDVLNAYTGKTPGVSPERSADGHFIHFMDVQTGADAAGGWDDSYSSIGSALLVAGAQFASNHFADAGSPLAETISALTEELTASIDFNAAIHPSLDGRVYLDMTPAGGGAGGAVRPWNEYQLVVSLALRQAENDRAVAVKHHWLNANNAPVRYLGGLPTLTDNPNGYAPAFWVQQAHFFNGDFRHDESFQELLENHRVADEDYSSRFLDEDYRYGLTAGVSPQGYHADRILNHPNEVFTPAAVAAWGDMETLLQYYLDHPPASDPRYRFGLARVSDDQPDWVPYDAGLVDHLFLLFGIVESLDNDFFADRVFATLLDGDYNYDGVVDSADYTLWRDSRGTTSDLRADGDLNGAIDHHDYAIWASNYGRQAVSQPAALTPEPVGIVLMMWLLAWRMGVSKRR